LLGHPSFGEHALIKSRSLTIRDGKVDVTEIQQVHEEIYNFLQEIGEGAFINTIRAQFKNFYFFGVSSYGAPPKDANTLTDDIRPHRVLDPILWLFAREGFIDTNEPALKVAGKRIRKNSKPILITVVILLVAVGGIILFPTIIGNIQHGIAAFVKEQSIAADSDAQNAVSPFEGIWAGEIDTYIFNNNRIEIKREITRDGKVTFAKIFMGTFIYGSQTITITFDGNNTRTDTYKIAGSQLTLIRDDGELYGVFTKVKQDELPGCWDDFDVRSVTDNLIEQALTSPAIKRYINQFATENNGNLPGVFVGTIRNESSEYIDTNIMAQMFQLSIIRTGKLDLITRETANTKLRENSTLQESDLESYLDSIVQLILQGTVNSIVDSSNNKNTRVYFVTATLVNMKTNRIIWEGEDNTIKKPFAQP
jgi:hypothetical protein